MYTDCSFIDLLAVLFFFFKQKTAYEMRISDWSSDVCSSDLIAHRLGLLFERRPAHPAQPLGGPLDVHDPILPLLRDPLALLTVNVALFPFPYLDAEVVEGIGEEIEDVKAIDDKARGRSEGRREGQECVRTCRSRGSPYI